MEKQFDIVAVGELNADLIFNGIVGYPEVGKEILADHYTHTIGSSTAIFAANAASLGCKVAFLGMLGTDNAGDEIERILKGKGVDTSFIMRSDLEHTGVTVVLNYGQDRANVTFPGAMSLMGWEQISKVDFSCAKHVHISSVFLQKQLAEDILPILKYIKSFGVTVSLDPQWDPTQRWDMDLESVLPLVDVFLPSEKELKRLTRKVSLDKAIEVVAPIIRLMVVKRGVRGSIMVSGDGSRRPVPALVNKDPVDCIGAGDSFNAGFIYSYVHGRSIDVCQDMGNLTGAINTTAAGGTGAFSSRETMEEAARCFGKTL